ncbi:MAG TPA: DUF6178 family protein [Polyangia bacterium]|jgi:hypothetical protein|nr:DUF6178 family protein [Polyangia bacterium]
MTEPKGTPAASDAPDNVIALSRYRAQLGRGKRLRRADALMSTPDPEQAIRALPGDELYYVLHEVGLRDAGDVLQYARAEQLQVVMDFALWQRDEVVPERLGEWLEVIAEAPYEKIGEWIAGLDTELVGLLIAKSCRIYDLSVEEAPDEPEGIGYPTPDRLFVLDVVGYPESDAAPSAPGVGDEPTASARALIRILDNLYRSDQQLARRLLVGIRSELPSSLEEMAYRWRAGRMADLGFSDYYEALEVYRELDPASVRLGEIKPGVRTRPIFSGGSGGSASMTAAGDSLRAPAALIERLGAPSTFARAASRISSPDEVADLHFGLVALTNRVLAADRVTPGSDADVAAALERMSGTLDIAVEFLARGDDDRALDAVRTVPLVRLFRLGVSLIGKVRTLALALKRHGPFAGSGQNLFEPEDATVIDAVTRLRPVFPRLLDDAAKSGERPFSSMADIARVTAAVGRAAAAQALLRGLGVKPQDVSAEAMEGTTAADAAGLDAGVLGRTALVLALLDSSSSAKVPIIFRPLDPKEVRAFGKRTATEDPSTMKTVDKIKQKAKAILDAATPKGLVDAAHEVAKRWIAGLVPLEPVVVRRPPPSRRRR